MRGLANGFLIGIPVVITVVSWWFGVQNERLDSLTLLAALYVLMLATRYGIEFSAGRCPGNGASRGRHGVAAVSVIHCA